ncbi:hypothetical protein ACH4PW_28095 [Streptomyces sp. NPDC017082]|uniref:hypothetical protein n=1 Tax=Streptomyces sp. NPDC017082 TaxID=3364974 RepID=UPI00379F8943
MSDETPNINPEDTPENDTVNPNAEAAKYRRKLREAETQLEAANTRIEALLRHDIEQRVSDRLAVPADLFDLGKATVADLLNEDGEVLDEAITAAVEALLEKRPGLAKPQGWGNVGGASRPSRPSDPAPTWIAALRGGRN